MPSSHDYVKTGAVTGKLKNMLFVFIPGNEFYLGIQSHGP